MVTLIRKFDFEAAHTLTWHPGKCRKLHGHTYKVELAITGEVGPDGVVMDFGDVKNIIKEKITDPFDHCYLNEFFQNPTAEMMAQQFLKLIQNGLTEAGFEAKADWLRLWETENSSVIAYGEK